MRNPSSAAISIRSAVSPSTRAISLFSKPEASISIVAIRLRPFCPARRFVSMQPRPFGYGAILVAVIAPPILNAQSSFTIVSAASYQATVAPDSLASMFGANLSPTTASATLDANGQLPTQLGGVGLQVDGQAAPLIYVSPLQINFVVPGSVTPGMVDVVIQSTNTGTTRTGAMQVQHTDRKSTRLNSSHLV